MLSREQAQKKVELKVNEPDPYWPEKPKIVVSEEFIEREWGWVFFYQSSEYLATNKFDSQLVGNAPYIVNKLSGELVETGTAHPIEYYIDEYEKLPESRMMSEPFSECKKCRDKMVRISPEDSSPLIVECQSCGHREYSEIQISPPWPAETENTSTDEPEINKSETQLKFLDLSAIPVSLGSPDENAIIPLGWILLWVLVIALAGLLIWIIL